MSVAWALNVWATNSWVGMNGGPPNAWRGASTPVAVSANVPGRWLSVGLPGQNHGEDAAAKRKRWESYTSPMVQAVSPAPKTDNDAEYLRKSASIAKSLVALRDEKESLLSRIAELDRLETAQSEREMLQKQQALQYAALQEAILLEQMEVIDIAFVAVVALTLQ